MQIRPILSTLRHHKLTAILLTLQVAFTCAIVCNVVFMVAQRVQRISVPTGIAENELSAIHSRGIEKDENVQARHVADLAALRAIPGERSAVAVSYSLPLNQSESSSGMCPSKQALDRAIQRNSIDGSGCVQPALYDGTPGLIATLGLHLVAGRDFLPDEYVSKGKPAVAIITRALAQKLYPGRSALGQSMYDGDNFFRVVGIVDTLLRPALSKPGVDGDSMIWPQRPDGSSVTYVLRSAPQDRQRVLKAAEAALLKQRGLGGLEHALAILWRAAQHVDDAGTVGTLRPDHAVAVHARLAQGRPQQGVHDADDAEEIVAVVHALSQRRASRIQLLRQRTRNDRDRGLALAHVLVRQEIASRNEMQAQRGDQARRTVVQGRLHATAAVDRIALYRPIQRLLAGAHATGIFAPVQRQRITDRHGG